MYSINSLLDLEKQKKCDQSLALMSAIVQAFTEYQTLEKYLEVCFTLAVLKKDVDLPTCYLRNDVNHFIHLVSQWKEVQDLIAQKN